MPASLHWDQEGIHSRARYIKRRTEISGMRFLPRIHFCWMSVLQQSRKKGSLMCLQEIIFNLWSESPWSSTFPPLYVMGFGSCEIAHCQRWGRGAGSVHHCWLNENPRAHSSSHYEICLWSYSFLSWTSVELHTFWLRGLPSAWKHHSQMNPIFKKIDIPTPWNMKLWISKCSNVFSFFWWNRFTDFFLYLHNIVPVTNNGTDI